MPPTHLHEKLTMHIAYTSEDKPIGKEAPQMHDPFVTVKTAINTAFRFTIFSVYSAG